MPSQNALGGVREFRALKLGGTRHGLGTVAPHTGAWVETNKQGKQITTFLSNPSSFCKYLVNWMDFLYDKEKRKGDVFCEKFT